MRRSLLLVAFAFACAPQAVKTTSTGPSVAPAPTPTPTEPVVQGPEFDDPVIAKIWEIGTRDSQVDAHLHYLTKEIGPRLTSSHNLMIAEAWTEKFFADLGLKAWREKWGEFPIGFDRGPWSGGMVTPEKVDYAFATMAWTPGVYGPHRGKAVLYPDSKKSVAKMKDQLKGAWVVKERKRRMRRRGEKPKKDPVLEALEEAGIAGFVINAGKPDSELVHTGGNHEIDWGELPSTPQIRLRGDQFADLKSRLEKGQEVELEFSVDNRFFRGPVPQHNVLAEIPGTDLAHEIVVVGGHLDSWDGAEGAVDNGTGVATTMEAARLLVEAGAKPRRTIRFMLWSGEEQGLFGSRGYVRDHEEEMPNISAVLVHDGGTNYLSGLRVTPEMMPQMEQVFAPVMKLAPETMPFELAESEALNTGGSDHTPFINAGVPGFFWEQDGKSDYDRMHHTQFDTLDTAVPEYQRHSALVVAMSAYGLANLDAMLDRTNSAPIPRRRMGVELDGTKIRELTKDGMAKKSGLKKGDEITAVDGKETKGTWDIVKAMQKGGPKKTLSIVRKGKKQELVMDYSDDPAEKMRVERRKSRAALKKAKR